MAEDVKPTAPVAPLDARAAKLKELADFMDAYEAKLAALSPADRKAYFFKNKSADDVRALNVFCNKADALRGPDRKAFFLAHPELEIRYSAANFTQPT